MSQSDPEIVWPSWNLTVTLDGEGVARCHSSLQSISLTPHELGMLLTALLKTCQSVGDGEEVNEVNLN